MAATHRAHEQAGIREYLWYELEDHFGPESARYAVGVMPTESLRANWNPHP